MLTMCLSNLRHFARSVFENNTIILRDYLYMSKFDERGEGLVSWYGEVFSFPCKRLIFSSVLYGFCPVNICISVVKIIKCVRYCLRIVNSFN